MDLLSELDQKAQRVRIQPCAPKQLVAIGKRYFATHNLHFNLMPQRFVAPSDSLYNAENLTQYVADGGTILVAIVDECLVGFVAGRKKPLKAEPRKVPKVEMYVDCIYVDENFRSKRFKAADSDGKSVPLALANAIMQSAVDRGCDELVFDFWSKNRIRTAK